MTRALVRRWAAVSLAARRTVAAVAALAAAATPAIADDAGGGQPAPPPASRITVVAFPDAEFFPRAIADPIRPQSALILQHAASSDISDTGTGRFLLRLGGRFALVRWYPEGRPECGWQLDFEGGFFGQFDIGNSLDNIGWDGLYGLLLSHKPRPGLGFRVGLLHDSPHVGDEYAERTGRRRLDATREELTVGASWKPAPEWRTYVAAGYGLGVESFQDPLRVQLGLEWLAAEPGWASASWYGAVDVTAFEESDLRPRTTIQVGFVVPTGRGSSRYRFALELTDGRSVLGEFPFAEETTISLGWYFDL